jgi:PPOX class probable F420-dependent enzyme
MGAQPEGRLMTSIVRPRASPALASGQSVLTLGRSALAFGGGSRDAPVMTTRTRTTVAARLPVTGLVRGTGAEIPASHLDLVDCPPVAALTTIARDGYPQTSVVWCDFDGAFVRVNTMRGFAKERNMRRDPRVTLLCYDPSQPLRYLEIRGRVVRMTEEGASQHLDGLASRYAGRPIRYFGGCIPVGFAETEVPVLCEVQPIQVVALDATQPGATL